MPNPPYGRFRSPPVRIFVTNQLAILHQIGCCGTMLCFMILPFLYIILTVVLFPFARSMPIKYFSAIGTLPALASLLRLAAAIFVVNPFFKITSLVFRYNCGYYRKYPDYLWHLFLFFVLFYFFLDIFYYLSRFFWFSDIFLTFSVNFDTFCTILYRFWHFFVRIGLFMVFFHTFCFISSFFQCFFFFFFNSFDFFLYFGSLFYYFVPYLIVLCVCLCHGFFMSDFFIWLYPLIFFFLRTRLSLITRSALLMSLS